MPHVPIMFEQLPRKTSGSSPTPPATYVRYLSVILAEAGTQEVTLFARMVWFRKQRKG